MRLSSNVAASTVLIVLAASSANAGFLDRLRPSPATAAAAPSPVPPADPSLDAFGGSGAQGAAGVTASPVQHGAPSVAAGQGAVKTGAPSQPTAAPVVEEPYDGLEFKWRFIRIRPAQLKLEALGLLIAGTYVFFSLIGKNANKKQATAWWKAHLDILTDNFASFTVKPGSVHLTRLNPSTFVGNASGRRGTSGMTATITTTPRHDVAQIVYEAGYKLYDLTYTPESSRVTVEFELDNSAQAGKEDFVSAICKKNYMMQLREERWDVASFAPVSERVNELGSDMVVFSESGQLTDWFTKRASVGIKELLSSNTPEAKKALDHFLSLTISDLVTKRPEESVLEKRGSIPKSHKLVLNLTLPSTAAAAETRPLVELALNLVDVLNNSQVPPEILKKTRNRRVEVFNLLTTEARKEAQDKKIAEARAIKRKAEDEKKERMSMAERRKYEQQQREKEQMKAAKKQQQQKSVRA